MKRIPELDGLRALAALAVIAHHLELWPPVTYWCRHGVDLFFVLSGYLITGIILREVGQPGFFRRFYWNRSIRIFPIYYLFLAAVLAFHLAFGRHAVNVHALIQYATYTQHFAEHWGWRTPEFFPELHHTWSLALEEQFYLIWPSLIILIGRRSPVSLSACVIVVAIVSQLAGMPDATLLGRCGGFGVGALLASLLTGRPSAWVLRGCLAAVTLSVLAFAIRLVTSESPLCLTAVDAIAGGLIGAAILTTGSPLWLPLRSKVLGWIAVRSYGIYLYQMPVVIFGERYLPRVAPWLGWGGRAVIIFAVSMGIAALSWHFIEQPLTRFKAKPAAPLALEPAQAAPVGVTLAD